MRHLDPPVYRHEALFYEGDDDLLAGTVHFLRNGVDPEGPALVALGGAKRVLRDALGGDATPSPSPRWRSSGATRRGSSRHGRTSSDHGEARGAVGIGEPIWPGRTAAELVECHRHEALLNLAFAVRLLVLLCPYDTESRRRSGGGVLHAPAPPRGRLDRRGRIPLRAIPGRPAVRRPPPRPRSFASEPAACARRATPRPRAGRAGFQRRRPRNSCSSSTSSPPTACATGRRGTLRLWHEPAALIARSRTRAHPRPARRARRPARATAAAAACGWSTTSATSCSSARHRTGTIVRVHMHVDPR